MKLMIVVLYVAGVLLGAAALAQISGPGDLYRPLPSTLGLLGVVALVAAGFLHGARYNREHVRG